MTKSSTSLCLDCKLFTKFYLLLSSIHFLTIFLFYIYHIKKVIQLFFLNCSNNLLSKQMSFALNRLFCSWANNTISKLPAKTLQATQKIYIIGILATKLRPTWTTPIWIMCIYIFSSHLKGLELLPTLKLWNSEV